MEETVAALEQQLQELDRRVITREQEELRLKVRIPLLGSGLGKWCRCHIAELCVQQDRAHA